MSTKPDAADSPATPPEPPAERYMTDEDADAQFPSLLWFDAQRGTEALDQYQGKFVAILGERILDADPDRDALGRRLDALGGSIPQYRVTVQHLPYPGDPYLTQRPTWPASGST